MTADHYSERDELRRDKLYRSSDDSIVAGVCAGLADFFGFDVTLTRVVVAIGMLIFQTLIVVYIILAILVPKRPPSAQPESRPRNPYMERRIKSEPHATLRSVRHRFRDLDRRLQRLEKHVTSKRYNLEREFEGLKDKE